MKKHDKIKILAIETSCDETAAAVISVENNYPVVLSSVVSSQIDLHAKTGGIVPEVASRAHMEAIIPIIEEALICANQIKSSKADPINSDFLGDITHIAVTSGPGLIGSLLVGFNTAKAIAYAKDLPIIPINHIEGHIYSAFAEKIRSSKSEILNKFEIRNSKFQFPILALTVSGGHTSLTLMKDHGKYQTIGETLDDAAGEAFDKVAKLLDLGFPGGPIISKLADNYRKRDQDDEKIEFPRPMINEPNFDFSFSGLKTAVLLEVKNQKSRIKNKNYKEKVAYSFEEAVVEVLMTKTLRAVKKYKPKSVLIAGGVAANKRLREVLESRITNQELKIAPLRLCGDNAAMIGLAAYFHILKGDVKSWKEIKVDSNFKI